MRGLFWQIASHPLVPALLLFAVRTNALSDVFRHERLITFKAITEFFRPRVIRFRFKFRIFRHVGD